MPENFDRQMDKIINTLAKEGKKPKLLMHACCAPCSTSCIERVNDKFDLTVFFYNPNMDTKEEYSRRAEEEIKLCKELKIKYVVEEYNSSEFYTAVRGHEEDAEGGNRCKICFNLRLEKTAKFAKEEGFDYFTTTLTVSPLKNASLLNEVGKECEEKYGISFLPSDFKKKNGYLRSIQLSKEYNLYRQNYCGCVFSRAKLPEKI